MSLPAPSVSAALDAPFSATARLSRWERLGLILFCAAAVAFGCLVEVRSAFLKRHMTDLQVYLRAAWAVRTGNDIYTITDDNWWHYHYPALLAILLTPLADAPAGMERTGLLPFATSVGLWYIFSLLCLFLGIHSLARALEHTSSDPDIRCQLWGCRRWWALRILPLLACLPPVGHTLMRGQVNLLLLALLCGMAAALVRGRSRQAGWWLASAICLKIIPAFLLLYPLWRRDWRCLIHCGLGLVLGLGIIPTAVFGPARTAAYFEEWTDMLLRPAMGAGTDQSRAKELIEATATDSQSFMAALHNLRYPDPIQRPRVIAPPVRLIHWVVGGLCTGLTLLAAGWRRRDDRVKESLFLGSLVILMAMLSPVCHLHYFCLSLLSFMGLMAAAWQYQRSLHLGVGLALLVFCNLIGNSLPHFAGLQALRDGGLAGCTAVLVWFAATLALWRRDAAPGVMKQHSLRAVAA